MQPLQELWPAGTMLHGLFASLADSYCLTLIYQLVSYYINIYRPALALHATFGGAMAGRHNATWLICMAGLLLSPYIDLPAS
jgi:hypothetical protein